MNSRSHADGACGARPQNVGEMERAISGVLGGWILSQLSARSIFGAIGAAAGVGLLYRSITGHCPMYERLGMCEMDFAGDEQLEDGGESDDSKEQAKLSEMHSDHGEIRTSGTSRKSTARAEART